MIESDILSLSLRKEDIKKIDYSDDRIIIYFKNDSQENYYSLHFKNQGIAQNTFISLLISLDVREQFGFFNAAEWTLEEGFKIL